MWARRAVGPSVSQCGFARHSSRAAAVSRGVGNFVSP
jgi:hypothetical protein